MAMDVIEWEDRETTAINTGRRSRGVVNMSRRYAPADPVGAPGCVLEQYVAVGVIPPGRGPTRDDTGR